MNHWRNITTIKRTVFKSFILSNIFWFSFKMTGGIQLSYLLKSIYENYQREKIIPGNIPLNTDVQCLFLDHITSGLERLKRPFRTCKLSNLKLISKGKIGDVYYVESSDGSFALKLSQINLPQESIFNEFTSSVASTEFLNESYIGSLLYLMNSPFFVKLYDFSYITINNVNYGVNMMEYCDLGTINDLSRNEDFLTIKGDIILFKDYIFRDIVIQVALGLHQMNSISFVSGDLKTKNILVKSENVEVKIDNNLIRRVYKSNICIKITDYGKSSCYVTSEMISKLLNANFTQGSIKLYNYSKLADLFISVSPLTYKIYNQNYYKIEEHQTLTYVRHSPKDYYPSFDFYCFLVSFLMIPEAYNCYMLNVYPEFNNALKYIFYDDLPRVMERIKGKQGADSINDCIDVLQDVCLPLDGLSVFLKFLIF